MVVGAVLVQKIWLCCKIKGKIVHKGKNYDSVAKIFFLQFGTIIFTVVCHFRPNEND